MGNIMFYEVVRQPVFIKTSLPIGTLLFVTNCPKVRTIKRTNYTIHEVDSIITRIGRNGKKRIKGIQRVKILTKRQPFIKKLSTTVITVVPVVRPLTQYEKVAKILSNMLFIHNMKDYCINRYGQQYTEDFNEGILMQKNDQFVRDFFGHSLVKIANNYNQFNIEITEHTENDLRSADLDGMLERSVVSSLRYKILTEDFITKR